jgi:hypothetical protein
MCYASTISPYRAFAAAGGLMTTKNNPPPITATECWVFHQGVWHDCSRPLNEEHYADSHMANICRLFLAAFGVGIGWSLGNLVVVFLSRAILTH